MGITHVTSDNFKQEVLEAKEAVLLDFWAPWCGPCRMLSPIIDELASELPGAKVCKVNIDEQPELAQSFRVMSIPALVAMKDGKVFDSSIGIRPKNAIVEMMSLA